MENCRYCGDNINTDDQEEYEDYIQKWAYNKQTKELDSLDYICMQCTESFGTDY